MESKKKHNIQYDRMIQTPVPRLIIRLAIPTVLSMMVTNLYNVVDTAFVGRLGTSASGAVGIVFGFMSILQAIGFTFGQGSGSIISRRLGDKDSEKASVIASTGFCLSFITAIVASPVWGRRYSVLADRGGRYVLVALVFACAAATGLLLSRVSVFAGFLPMYVLLYFFQSPSSSLMDALTIDEGQRFGHIRTFGAIGFAKKA